MQTQTDAWSAQINLLKAQLAGLPGAIFFEFTIPRMGRRIDVVVISGPVVFAIEFKVGAKTFDPAALVQAWDYALDLKNFHEASHAPAILPILIATETLESGSENLVPDADDVYRPLTVTTARIRRVINTALERISGPEIDADLWFKASYYPTPTIVEAACALYADHSVDDIARHDAGAKNLNLTSKRIEDLVDSARANREKVICFVTRVPGAGKTLVGLNLATRKREEADPTHAVFLSGNRPLVEVLREALTRDDYSRRKANGEKVRKGKIGESVKAFIQNIHHFRDDALVDASPPAERVVVFDEAQRAWNLEQTANFMQRKKGRSGFSQSEPEFLISCMDRHTDWAVIVCLVGGGQEINTGEAGIGAWLEAINKSFPDWRMFISSQLVDNEYAAGKALSTVQNRDRTDFDDSLHLSVSMRTFRAENVSELVKAILDCEEDGARAVFKRLSRRYPILLTRDLDRAKRWIRTHARGTERYGLVTSSKAQRLKPHAIDVRVEINPVHWFLNDNEDTRSSYYLEDAATEFQVQGLELDWTCVTWDADLRYHDSGWSFHSFRGDKWTHVHKAEKREYLRNAYRVLLTRARQGMVIFIPPGDASDPTRDPECYDSTFNYLLRIGIPVIE